MGWAALFVRELVDERGRRLASWSLLASAAVSFAMAIAFLLVGREHFYRAPSVYVVPVMAIILAVLIAYARRRPELGLWVLAGMSLLVLGSLLPMMRTLGWLPVSFVTEYGVQLGGALEIPLVLVGIYFRSGARRDNRQRMGALMRTDPLTGVGNHRVLVERLQQLQAPGRRAPFQGAVMQVHVANLEAIREQYGREAAEAAMVRAAECVTRETKEGDTVAREEGGDLVLVLEGQVSRGQATEIGRNIIARGLKFSRKLPPRVTLNLRVAGVMSPLARGQCRRAVGHAGAGDHGNRPRPAGPGLALHRIRRRGAAASQLPRRHRVGRRAALNRRRSRANTDLPQVGPIGIVLAKVAGFVPRLDWAIEGAASWQWLGEQDSCFGRCCWRCWRAQRPPAGPRRSPTARRPGPTSRSPASTGSTPPARPRWKRRAPPSTPTRASRSTRTRSCRWAAAPGCGTGCSCRPSPSRCAAVFTISFSGTDSVELFRADGAGAWHVAAGRRLGAGEPVAAALPETGVRLHPAAGAERGHLPAGAAHPSDPGGMATVGRQRLHRQRQGLAPGAGHLCRLHAAGADAQHRQHRVLARPHSPAVCGARRPGGPEHPVAHRPGR